VAERQRFFVHPNGLIAHVDGLEFDEIIYLRIVTDELTVCTLDLHIALADPSVGPAALFVLQAVGTDLHGIPGELIGDTIAIRVDVIAGLVDFDVSFDKGVVANPNGIAIFILGANVLRPLVVVSARLAHRLTDSQTFAGLFYLRIAKRFSAGIRVR